jgi:hypothetical protein
MRTAKTMLNTSIISNSFLVPITTRDGVQKWGGALVSLLQRSVNIVGEICLYFGDTFSSYNVIKWEIFFLPMQAIDLFCHHVFSCFPVEIG